MNSDDDSLTDAASWHNSISDRFDELSSSSRTPEQALPPKMPKRTFDNPEVITMQVCAIYDEQMGVPTGSPILKQVLDADEDCRVAIADPMPMEDDEEEDQTKNDSCISASGQEDEDPHSIDSIEREFWDYAQTQGWDR